MLVAAGLLAALVTVALAFLWQERRRPPEDAVIYGVEDAIAFVRGRLRPQTAARLRPEDVRRILAWEMRYVQDPDLRQGETVVVGGLEAAQYAQERAVAEGHPYDGDVIIEVLDLQAEYLAALGAVGDPVGGVEVQQVIDRWADRNSPGDQEETSR